MQLAPLATDRPAAQPRRLDAPAATRRIDGTAARADAPAPQAPRALPARGGVASWNPQLNQRVASAQQAGQFLGGLAAQLQQFKAETGRAAAGEEGLEGTLDQQRLRLQRTWQRRPEASGGSLDASLGYSADGPAQQRFTLRGIDARSLQTKGAETLTFSLNSAPWQALAVQIDPELDMRALAARFDSALASTGIRVRADAQGELEFAIAQPGWERVRDRLLVKGDGKRFPTGQFARVRAEPEAAAIDPAQWQTDSPEAARQTLVQVLQSLRRVERAQVQVQDALAQADQTLDTAAAAAADSTAASRFARGFEALARNAGYPGLSALAGGLQALPRQRVERLLGLE